MKRVAAVPICLALAASLQADGTFDGNAIDRAVEAYRLRAGVPGIAIAVTKGDRVLHVAGYGHDGSGQPITPTTKLPIASLSKSFTSLAVMQLVEAGKVVLDHPVREYIEDFRLADPRSGAITVRQILMHRSGLSDATFHEKSGPLPGSLREGVALLSTARLSADPGAKFQYHNPNYWVAARLVEVVSGQPFAEYLRHRVFEPLGMRDTIAIDASSGAQIASGYIRFFGRPVALAEPAWFLGGAAGIVSTASDMARWLEMQSIGGLNSDGRQVISSAAVDAMHADLGWRTVETAGATRVEHSGWMFTFSAEQVLLPKTGYGIAVMSNLGLGLAPVDSEVVADMLVDMAEGRAARTPGPIGFRVDMVLLALMLASLLTGIVGVRNAALWADVHARRRGWRRALRLFAWLLPTVLLLGLPAALRFIYAGRDASYLQMLYVVPTLVSCLAVASVAGLAVVASRVTARRSLPRRRVW